MDSNPVILQKPSEKTLKQIDFVIQGLENGKFEEISKAVEFHQKLKGDDDPTYFSGLWAFIEMQQRRIHDLELENGENQTKQMALTTRIDNLESKLTNYTNNMRGIAGGLGYLSKPDPFGTDYTNNWDTSATEQFISEWKNKY